MSKLVTWRGRRIEEFDREELLEVVRWLADHYERSYSPESIRERALGRVEMMRRER